MAKQQRIHRLNGRVHRVEGNGSNEFAAMSEAERKLFSPTIAKANLDARADSWQKLMSATTESIPARRLDTGSRSAAPWAEREGMSRAAVEFRNCKTARNGAYIPTGKKSNPGRIWKPAVKAQAVSAEYAGARSLRRQG